MDEEERVVLGCAIAIWLLAIILAIIISIVVTIIFKV